MKLEKMEFEAFRPDVFQVFHTQNALLTAGDRQHANTMTIGWCQLGCIWNLPTCTVYVRPERYTYQFMERSDYFTVSVLPKGSQEIMALCGTKSGREVDKFSVCGLTVQYGVGDAPYPAEAEWVLVCKKLFVQDMAPEFVQDDRIFRSYTTAKGGWHRIYTGEVVKAYKKAE